MLYRVLIEQKTEVIGKVTSNTLFGAFLTAYSNIYDIDDDMVNDIILSDLFTEDNLPKGVKNNNTIYSKIINEQDVLVNRTLIARDNESNNIVNNVIGHKYKNKNYEFYVSTELLTKEDLEIIIKLMLEFGIGKWRNVGKGHFKLISIEEYIPKTNITSFVALSSFIPDDNINESDIISLGYTIRDAISTNGKKQKTTAMLLTGTQFKSIRQIVGKHTYDKESETYIHGKAIVIGV